MQEPVVKPTKSKERKKKLEETTNEKQEHVVLEPEPEQLSKLARREKARKLFLTMDEHEKAAKEPKIKKEKPKEQKEKTSASEKQLPTPTISEEKIEEPPKKRVEEEKQNEASKTSEESSIYSKGSRSSSEDNTVAKAVVKPVQKEHKERKEYKKDLLVISKKPKEGIISRPKIVVTREDIALLKAKATKMVIF